MKVADLMVTELAVVNEDVTLADAVVSLADAHVHGAPVVDRRGRLVGALSSSDILQAAAESTAAGAGEEFLAQTLVRDVMTSPPRTVSPDEDVKVAAQKMLELDMHRLFVVRGNDMLGVISQSDIVRALAVGKL
ncbi:MAG: CBS domain-containing protein [Gemmatimonadota bacterium]|nr:MAG: CBS domain-containing protein [Gemmatimonadota bacterium]